MNENKETQSPFDQYMQTQQKIDKYIEAQRLIHDDDIGVVLSYATMNWRAVRKTLVSMLQTTLLSQGAISLFQLKRSKLLHNLSKMVVIYANLIVIKEQHKEGLKEYKKQLLSEVGKEFYKGLDIEDKDEIVNRAKVLAGLYHNRNSKDGLKKMREIMELWGLVFHENAEDCDRFLALTEYLMDYYKQ